MARKEPPVRLLRSLNLFGLDHLDPVILAALADERPLLLIGRHGTAKSELLNRLAAALGLAHRHYNASLISFDDLLGYPVPNAAHDGLDYLKTPGSLWGAESVFLDEISRCRPESQNKLFSVIHEKRIQGLALEHLRYRWAAMNPPAALAEGAAEGEEIYEGSMPLDPALADRFGYIVAVPDLAEFGREDRLDLVRKGGLPPAAPPDLQALVARTRETLAALDVEYRDWVARYVEALIDPLREAGLPISGRRAGTIAACVQAVTSAYEALGHPPARRSPALIALKWCLPQRARGIAIPDSRLGAIHRLAAQAAGEPADSPWPAIRRQTDPGRRIALALREFPARLSRFDISNIVTDAFASMRPEERYLLAAHLAPIATRTGCLNVPAFDLLAAPLDTVRLLASRLGRGDVMDPAVKSYWAPYLEKLGKLAAEGIEGVRLANLILAFFEREGPLNVEALTALDRKWRSLFTSATEEVLE